MRIDFLDKSNPNGTVCRLQELVNTDKVTAQEVSAYIFGYSGWSELVSKIGTQQPSIPDEQLPEYDLALRREYQAQRLTQATRWTYEQSMSLLKEWQPSAQEPSGTEEAEIEYLSFADSLREFKSPSYRVYYTVFKDILHWPINGYDPDPSRLHPFCWTYSQTLKAPIALIASSLAYLPDDRSDRAVRRDFKELAARYPKGAMLIFRTPLTLKVDDQYFAYLGSLYYRKKWQHVLLNNAMDSIDKVLSTADAGVDFSNPGPELADNEGKLVRAVMDELDKEEMEDWEV